jgi:hypothetical protein
MSDLMLEQWRRKMLRALNDRPKQPPRCFTCGVCGWTASAQHTEWLVELARVHLPECRPRRVLVPATE